MVVSGTVGTAGIADLFGMICVGGVHAGVGSDCGSIATIGADQSGSSSAAPGSSSPATDESGASKSGVAAGWSAFIPRASVAQANASVPANSSLRGKGLSRCSECHVPNCGVEDAQPARFELADTTAGRATMFDQAEAETEGSVDRALLGAAPA